MIQANGSLIWYSILGFSVRFLYTLGSPTPFTQAQACVDGFADSRPSNSFPYLWKTHNPSECDVGFTVRVCPTAFNDSNYGQPLKCCLVEGQRAREVEGTETS